MYSHNTDLTLQEAQRALALGVVLRHHVRQAGGDPRVDIDFLLSDEGKEVMRHVAQVVAGRRLGHFRLNPELLELSCDRLYNLGGYDGIMSDFSRAVEGAWNKSTPRTGPAHLVSYEGGLTTTEVLDRISGSGFTPATPRELLIFGASQSEWPRRSDKGVAALGEIFRDDQGPWAACITKSGLGRRVGGDYDDWEDPWFFLVFKEESGN